MRKMTLEQLYAQRDPDSQARIDKMMAENRVQYALQELRDRRGLTQAEVAELLGIAQKNVSALEGREDMLISTLRRFVEALGGRLRVNVEFEGEEPLELSL